MAVVNTKSTIVSDADNSPVRQTKGHIFQGRKRTLKATVEVAAADDDGSVFRLARIASHWSIESIRIFNDAITGGTDYDLGVYDTAEDGGAVVDVNAYADAISLASASVVGVEQAFEARDIANVEQSVWQDVGLTEDSRKWYDLCLTGVTVGTAAGTITAVVTYTDGS